MFRTAIILGASGLVGSELLKQLLDDKNVFGASASIGETSGQELNTSFEKIKVFVRKPLAVAHPKFEQIIVDFDSIGNYSHAIKGDVLFCCLGTTIATAGSKDAFIKVDHTYPLEFAKIAKQNGLKKILLISSLGADKTASNFYLKVKGDIEWALEQLKFESLIILRPSLLLGDRNEFRFGEVTGKLVMKLFSFAFMGKLKKYKAIQASDVAKAMVKLAKLKTEGSAIFLSDELQKLADKGSRKE